jgi:hypothetical protein
MPPEAGLSRCRPHSGEWHDSQSRAGGAVLLSGRSVERRSDYGHFGSVDWSARQDKGKCALGPFLSILVIECQHKCLNVNLCTWMDIVRVKVCF